MLTTFKRRHFESFVIIIIHQNQFTVKKEKKRVKERESEREVVCERERQKKRKKKSWGRVNKCRRQTNAIVKNWINNFCRQGCKKKKKNSMRIFYWKLKKKNIEKMRKKRKTNEIWENLWHGQKKTAFYFRKIFTVRNCWCDGWKNFHKSLPGSMITCSSLTKLIPI